MRESPTLARRFPSGPGTRPYRLAPPLPVQSSIKPEHLLSAVIQLYGLGQDDRKLQAAVERDGHALERRVGLPRLRIGVQLLMGEHVVRHHQRARFERLPCELEERLVVFLLGIEKAQVEHVLRSEERREGKEC